MREPVERVIARSSRITRKKQANQGQALVEYIILLSIVVGIVGYFLHKLTGGFDNTTARFGGRIEQQLRTGALSPRAWNK